MRQNLIKNNRFMIYLENNEVNTTNDFRVDQVSHLNIQRVRISPSPYLQCHFWLPLKAHDIFMQVGGSDRRIPRTFMLRAHIFNFLFFLGFRLREWSLFAKFQFF